MRAYDPDCVKTMARFSSFWRSSSRSGLKNRKRVAEMHQGFEKSPAQACIAAISAPIPKIFIARFKL
jgi:hypothetical protein